jgi:GT2 family glycosyltransferase
MDLKRRNIFNMTNSNVDISVIIVNYKTPQLLLECVQSIVDKTKDVSFEIVIVDNNSEDESEMLIKNHFQKVKWINSGYNAGFARANNIGIRNAIGSYILLLNSDTIVNEKTLINTFNDYIDLEKTKQKIGMLACQLIDLNGNIQHNSRPKVRNIEKIIVAHPFVILMFRIFRIKPEDKERSHEKSNELHTVFHETKWLGGTFLFYNKDISLKNDYFLDEDFFMYGEDTEWSLRLRKKGYKHFFTPNASVIHAEGGSFKIKAPKWVQISISEWLFIMKNYGKIIYFFVALINLTGLQLDNALTKRHNKKLGNKVNNQDLESFEIRKQVVLLLKKHFFKILFIYKRKTSSSKEYLKTF